MGFFKFKRECAICNNETGLKCYHIADDKCICRECFEKSGISLLTPIKAMTEDDIKKAINNRNEYKENLIKFNATKKIGTFIEFDDNQKKWIIPYGNMGKKKYPKIYNYSDIVDFELLEDGVTITKGGLGAAIAGGVLFGGVGAIVGGTTGAKKSKSVCNSLKIKITINDINNPVVYINFITTETKKNSYMYQGIYNSAQECLSTLQLIYNNQETRIENNNVAQFSSADEILKFKNLLDSGIITQEQFEAKKNQLLGLGSGPIDPTNW